MRIHLPEQVWLEYEPASIASRSLAFIVDFLLRWTVVLVVFLTAVAFQIGMSDIYSYLSRQVGEARAASSSAQLVLAFIIAAVLVIEISYPMYFEVRRQGVSPGKKLMGLRVVDLRGLPLTAKTSFLRTIFTVIDFLGLGFVALVAMLISKRSQRLADLAANTMVVHDRAEAIDDGLSDANGDAQRPLLVSQKTYAMVQSVLARYTDLVPEARQKVMQQLQARLQEEGIAEHRISKTGADECFEALMALYPQLLPRRKGQQVLDTGIDWPALQKEFTEAESAFAAWKVNKQVGRQEVFEVVETFQVICQRLAYLQTYYPQAVQTKRAAQLVRQGRMLLYGKRLAAREELERTLLRRIPQSFLHFRPYVLFSAIALISGAVLAAVLVQVHPGLGFSFIDEDTARQLEAGSLWTERIQGMSSIASSGITTNNIKVTFTALASSVTAGVLTLALMFFNGAHIGGIFSTLARYDGMAWKLFDFITAHGVLELSVIAVAGGVGLYIGDALIKPGSETRVRAFAQRAKKSIDITIFNALCLVVAGIVEGYISPYAHYPYVLKLSVGLSLGFLYWWFLFSSLRVGGMQAVADKQGAN